MNAGSIRYADSTYLAYAQAVAIAYPPAEATYWQLPVSLLSATSSYAGLPLRERFSLVSLWRRYNHEAFLKRRPSYQVDDKKVYREIEGRAFEKMSIEDALAVRVLGIFRQAREEAGSLVVSAGIDVFSAHEEVSRFEKLLGERRSLAEGTDAKATRALQILRKENPDSIDYIEAAFMGCHDANHEDVLKMLVAVRYLSERLRKIKKVKPDLLIQGPLIASFFIYGAEHEKVRAIRCINSTSKAVSIIATATGELTVISAVAGYNPFESLCVSAGVPKLLQRKLHPTLYPLFEALRTSGLLSTIEKLDNLASLLEQIYKLDPLSFDHVIEHIKELKVGNEWDLSSWNNIRRAMDSTLVFVRRERGRKTWTGRVFEFFYANHGQQAFLQGFHQAMTKYKGVTGVEFEGGVYRLIRA